MRRRAVRVGRHGLVRGDHDTKTGQSQLVDWLSNLVATYRAAGIGQGMLHCCTAELVLAHGRRGIPPVETAARWARAR